MKLFTIILSLALSINLFSQEKEVIEPPFLAQSNNFMMAAYYVDAEVVKPYLPEHLSPKLNQEGKAAVSIELYETKKINSLPNFKIAFMVVEVNEHPSKDDAAGRFPIWGISNKQEIINTMNKTYGFPYEINQNINFSSTANGQRAEFSLKNGSKVCLNIEKLKNKPLDSSGIVNMLGVIENEKTTITKIPYHSKGYLGKVVSLEIQSTCVSPFDLLKDKQPFFCMFSEEQVFTYCVPLVKSK